VLTHVYQILQERAERFPSAVAIGGQGGLAWKTLTSRELLDLVDSVACQLSSVQAGDRVVVWLPNDWLTPVYLFALWKRGAIVVPFDHDMNAESAAHIIDSVEPCCILVGFEERPPWTHGLQLTQWWEPKCVELAQPDLVWSPPSEELATISFTSGTTGQPKGCMITHANLCSQVRAAFQLIPLDPSCRLASILPLSHLFELTCGLLYPLAAGAAIHYVPSRRGADVVRVLSEQRITHMLVVPQLLAIMGEQIEQQLRAAIPSSLYPHVQALADRLPPMWRRRLFWTVHRRLGGCLRMLLSGGAALAPEVQQVWQRLGFEVVQGYGTSECSPMIACGRSDGSTPQGSVGQPISNVQVRLAADGELQVRGPNVMKGYWKDPARTKEVLDEDGWYSTGDLASIDKNGNIFLQGRARDLIVLPSGLKVWPQDVEDVLRAESVIKDAAVVVYPTPTGGAALHAYLIPSEPAATSTSLSALVARCNGRLAQHQRLASASWWAEADFPRTSILKVRRYLLPRPETSAVVNLESLPAVDDPVGLAVAGVARVQAVQGSQTLSELGLDSLGVVELAAAVEEKTGQHVADADLRVDMTVDQLRALLAGNAAVAPVESAPDAVGVPDWPYTWGRALRVLSAPFDVLYRIAVTSTVILGRDNLHDLPPVVVFAGTHHSFADVPLLRRALQRSPARRLADRLLITAAPEGVGWESPWGRYAILAFGLYRMEPGLRREASLRQVIQLARAGNSIVIFPQGGHTRPEQERSKDASVQFRPGVAHLSTALACPVVPFGVAGTEQLMPAFVENFRGRIIAGVPVTFKRGPLAIAFGPALRVDPDETPGAFAARLEKVCYALTRDAERAIAQACPL
jgi:long-chain acyl-CoA synthetase